MDTALIVVELLFGALGLHFGAGWLVSGSSRVALSFNIKPLVIGLTLVAFGTSAPELTVSVAGVISGDSDISVGNVIGSNIANIGLVLGIAAMIRPIPVDMEVFRRDFPAMLCAALLIVVLAFIGGPVADGDSVGFRIDRWKAAILLGALALVIYRTFRGAREVGEASAESTGPARQSARNLSLAFAGLAVLVVGGHFFVEGAVAAAVALGVPSLVIALSVVAIGTSLPELATSIVAIRKGHSEISLGNVVGSNIFNILMVLGLVSLISPLVISAEVMRSSLPVMLFFSLLLVGLAWRGKRISRLDGGVMFVAYLIYTANLFGGWV